MIKKVDLMCITAIIGVVVLEGMAIMKDIDGAFLGAAIAVIAGLGGYQIGLRTPTPPQQ